MPRFVVPQFNLVCDIWTGPPVTGPFVPPAGAPRLAGQSCALVYGSRTNVSSTGGTTSAGVALQTMNLLLPGGTDVRGPQDATAVDVVECPTGSGRWYAVTFVDDIGKGWANEHRTASLQAIEKSWNPPYS